MVVGGFAFSFEENAARFGFFAAGIAGVVLIALISRCCPNKGHQQECTSPSTETNNEADVEAQEGSAVIDAVEEAPTRTADTTTVAADAAQEQEYWWQGAYDVTTKKKNVLPFSDEVAEVEELHVSALQASIFLKNLENM